MRSGFAPAVPALRLIVVGASRCRAQAGVISPDPLPRHGSVGGGMRGQPRREGQQGTGDRAAKEARAEPWRPLLASVQGGG